jgi:predicted nuclease of predicted toxin-antitoxin system
MKFKLDENLGVRIRQVFLDAGHDVQTVRDEQLQGRSDEVIYEVCRLERRCLVTLDPDFSNVLRFPPEPTAGIAVLRPTHGVSLDVLGMLARELVVMLASQSIEGQVWIVEPGRIRIHQSSSEERP